jgi:hypothetical protein
MRLLKRLLPLPLAVLAVLAFASPASAGVRVVQPGGSFRLANHAVIDEVWIKGARPLRMRCVGDGCDWRRRNRPRIIAHISELDRIFHSVAGVPLRVRTVRQ